jgi:thymidylate synthase (FAD)
MKVFLLHRTKDAEILCASAALGCNSEEPVEDIPLTADKIAGVLKQVITSGHHSILEHMSYTFSVSGVSRVLTHQLVRHRMASYSQQSQRCIPLDVKIFITPPTIGTTEPELELGNDYATKIFNDAMENAWKAYYELVHNLNIPAEDARYVLPGACSTNITITMNARELFHFFELRMCNRAQWEIRELANKMYEICMDENIDIFKYAGPKCWTSKCTEIKSCGHPPQRASVHIS